MRYSVLVYCPDEHISYNVHTLDKKGVGGGITTRIRMAHALAELGHKVTIYNNCPNNRKLKGVQYLHNSLLKNAKTDIFIASTSGDKLDLSSLRDKSVDARLRILLVHGINPPKGIDNLSFDYFYVPSSFVYNLVVNKWGIIERKMFVSHRGVMERYYEPNELFSPKRDLRAIIYSGHPSKGLEVAINVIRLLRQTDPGYSLHIYGGHQLWGEEKQMVEEEDGVYFHGLVGQKELARRMKTHGFCINLQSIEDTFGIVNIEAMRAGCIVVASDVGAYSEIIRNGYNGFLVSGNHAEKAVQNRAAQLILELMRRPDYCDFIRRNAFASPMDWSIIANAWENHWSWALGDRTNAPLFELGMCNNCGAEWLLLADGFHCTGCGRYRRDLSYQ